ncbi:hypothetical protein T492DRAFT_834604 [Pavlovales sp. CCMP2436]|nr:hypothetical protein T492DRAFT_834604 [Pavlovales sp. CCMP2436]
MGSEDETYVYEGPERLEHARLAPPTDKRTRDSAVTSSSSIRAAISRCGRGVELGLKRRRGRRGRSKDGRSRSAPNDRLSPPRDPCRRRATALRPLIAPIIAESKLPCGGTRLSRCAGFKTRSRTFRTEQVAVKVRIPTTRNPGGFDYRQSESPVRALPD